MITLRIRKKLGSLLLAGGILAAGGFYSEAFAQRDPFAKPTVKPVRTGGDRRPAGAPLTPVAQGPLGAPPVESRVNYYMNVLRPQCIQQGCTNMPKPTVVMTLSEMQVTGISRTPRGYAAIVELTPIKLSYTIYPGEKFFDGQLVAVEENQLIFRKVTKMSNGKFNVAEEKKILRKMSFQEEMARNSVDSLPSAGATENEKRDMPADKAANDPSKMADPNKIVFPMDEMVKSEKDTPKDAKEKAPAKGAKGAKGGVKTAANKKN